MLVFCIFGMLVVAEVNKFNFHVQFSTTCELTKCIVMYIYNTELRIGFAACQ